MKRVLIAIVLILLVTIFSLPKAMYDFLAHKHALPMFGVEYVVIPTNAPRNQNLFVNSYSPVTESALDRLDAHRQLINSPGISAAVAIDGELVWAGTAGWANIESNKPLTPASQFRIGSTSKSLTATLLARMVDSGVLTLDTPLSNYQVGKLNQDRLNITPRQLASHMAG
ncbi:MAG: serine hydrolase domain-containing protein, partial [Kangiellaceae bacterium]|nr:serine hydrolase domain-containing protein [Kangiellaceae bacterium]